MALNIHIREATASDLPVLLEFEQAIIKAERPFDPTLADNPISYYDLGKMIQDPDIGVIVAETNNKIISSGYAVIKPARHYLDHTQYAYLGFMYTIPEFRGRGVNGKIVEVLKEWAVVRGLKEIRLTVYDDNDPAIKAYEKVGFKKHLIEMRMV